MKWPIRTFAITGMLTALMMSRIICGSLMRATPPSLRMSDGTRSSAMTETAPGLLRNDRLLGGHHVHDHAALEHLCQAGLDSMRAGFDDHAVLRGSASAMR